MKTVHSRLQKKLLFWFEENKRSFPWRQSKNPYEIWISEVMLQQTTSRSVLPYYKKFIEKFPSVSSLARASEKEVFSMWSGLGYYKRAQNLLLAAKELEKKKRFPNTYQELLDLPGFGPYTSRAVSSIAFEESVGVVDGNVIRFLSRFHGLPLKSWLSSDKKKLQDLSDLWVKNQKSSIMNQALMEIGSLICKSHQPLCLLCPLVKSCQAQKQSLQQNLPLKKNRKKVEFWYWKVERIKKKSRWAFIKNKQLPFFKNYFIPPGVCKQIKQKPKRYDFSHCIMNYQIFIHIQKQTKKKYKSLQWFTKSQIKELNPSSLIKKILN